MKIALISDIHYGKLATSHEFAIEGEPLALGEVQNAKPLLQGIIDILREEQPSTLLIAGDLTSTGSPVEFKYCYKTIMSLAEATNIDPSRILFCMGNHDVDWRITKITDSYTANYINADRGHLESFYQQAAYTVAETTLQDKEFEKMYPKYLESWGKPFAGIVEYDDCIVFVLNSSFMSSHNQELKHGILSAEQLEWFSTHANTYKDINKLKIVLLHHHPRKYQNVLPQIDSSILEEGDELSNICGTTGIRLIIHGHRHQPQATTRNETGWINPVTYICAGSLAVNASERYQVIPNTFHIIDYQSEEQISLKNYSYSPEDGWFPTRNCTATPVDSVMLLGKDINPDKITDAVLKLPHNKNIDYSSLDTDLKYLPNKTLSDMVQRLHPDSELFDKFPDHFLIYNHEEMRHD